MVWAAALIGPVVVTAVLVNFSHQVQRDYVFIYLGLVAVAPTGRFSSAGHDQRAHPPARRSRRTHTSRSRTRRLTGG
jgi:hypothetical protein